MWRYDGENQMIGLERFSLYQNEDELKADLEWYVPGFLDTGSKMNN